MTVDADEFRQALACWASGVTIVTAEHEGERLGMTVSSFTSVSLDPPLILVCADKGSNTLPIIEASESFTVNILAQGQEELAQLFADKGREAQRFNHTPYENGTTGAPHLTGAMSHLDCYLHQAIDAGDHSILIGAVVDVDTTDQAPLLYCRGNYREYIE